MRVTMTPEALRALEQTNGTRTWTVEEAAPLIHTWFPWLQASGVLQMFYAPCKRSNLALRIFVPASALEAFSAPTGAVEWSAPLQAETDKLIKAGYIMVMEKDILPSETPPNGGEGNLLVDLWVILNATGAEKISVAKCLVFLKVKCAHCHTLGKADAIMPTCTRCQLVYYCNDSCEAKHRPWHERVCGVPPRRDGGGAGEEK
jgi:hypothetical protein